MNMCGHHSQGKNHLQVLVFSHLAAYWSLESSLVLPPSSPYQSL